MVAGDQEKECNRGESQEQEGSCGYRRKKKSDGLFNGLLGTKQDVKDMQRRGADYQGHQE